VTVTGSSCPGGARETGRSFDRPVGFSELRSWFYHQPQYHRQAPRRQRRRRRRRRRPRRRRPRRPASAGVLAATFTAVAKLVTPTAVPTVVPTALMHQNKAMATAATAFASNLRGALDLLLAPEGNGLCPISVHPSFLSRTAPRGESLPSALTRITAQYDFAKRNKSCGFGAFLRICPPHASPS